ncbi:hypothetical protein BDC45DRAFT_533211 [Circinella umbellata]|nr:hypothetical protein BDC45DRAFT_533210 [Circinella umbellata]KAI7856750.1 hypothetical protein BDC45DRAFT_533211 [Circinella umbellata]
MPVVICRRPDATLTKLDQLSYKPSLGSGEAKVAHLTTTNNDLCHDILSLRIFYKEAIDIRHWNYFYWKNSHNLYPGFLAQISESFWQLCKSVPASEIDIIISNSRPTHRSH